MYENVQLWSNLTHKKAVGNLQNKFLLSVSAPL